MDPSRNSYQSKDPFTMVRLFSYFNINKSLYIGLGIYEHGFDPIPAGAQKSCLNNSCCGLLNVDHANYGPLHHCYKMHIIRCEILVVVVVDSSGGSGSSGSR